MSWCGYPNFLWSSNFSGLRVKLLKLLLYRIKDKPVYFLGDALGSIVVQPHFFCKRALKIAREHYAHQYQPNKRGDFGAFVDSIPFTDGKGMVGVFSGKYRLL